MPVHNHGPECGPGLLCGERRLEDGTLRGHCLEEQLFCKMPVYVGEVRVGMAELSRDCEIISIELNSGQVPDTIRQMILTGMTDGLTIDCHTTPAVPAEVPPMTQEEKSARWNQTNLPYGM